MHKKILYMSLVAATLVDLICLPSETFAGKNGKEPIDDREEGFRERSTSRAVMQTQKDPHFNNEMEETDLVQEESLAIPQATLQHTVTPFIETQEQQDSSYRTTLSALLQRLKQIAPDHRKSFVNSFVSRTADLTEVALHNLSVHYGGVSGRCITEKLNDFIAATIMTEIIEEKLDLCVQFVVQITSNALSPGSGLFLTTPTGQAIIEPLQSAIKFGAQPFTEIASNTCASASRVIFAPVGYVFGGVIGEKLADKYIDGISKKIKRPFLSKVTYIPSTLLEKTRSDLKQINERYHCSDKSWWSLISSSVQKSCTLVKGVMSTIAYAGTVASAGKVGTYLAEKHIRQILDEFGDRIGYHNYSIFERKRLTLTERKSRSYFLECARTADKYLTESAKFTNKCLSIFERNSSTERRSKILHWHI